MHSACSREGGLVHCPVTAWVDRAKETQGLGLGPAVPMHVACLARWPRTSSSASLLAASLLHLRWAVWIFGSSSPPPRGGGGSRCGSECGCAACLFIALTLSLARRSSRRPAGRGRGGCWTPLWTSVSKRPGVGVLVLPFTHLHDVVVECGQRRVVVECVVCCGRR
jgi:hypothetical protein